jgi:hypothetical protein
MWIKAANKLDIAICAISLNKYITQI